MVRTMNVDGGRRFRITERFRGVSGSLPILGRLGLALVLLLAIALRAAAYFEAPRPIEGAGLAAEQSEMARNIVERGKWFVVNDSALVLLQQRQTQEQQL